MLDALLPWFFAAPALVALGLSAANAVWWPRGRRAARLPPGVSVCVPARNEALGIEACLRSILRHDVYEVVVVDDGSTDDTPAILARLAAEAPRLKVYRLDAALPEGWIGKPRACAILEARATGSHLVFVDADVVLNDDGLLHLYGLQQDLGADVVTAVPRQETVTFMERLVLPLLHVTYTSWLFLPLIWKVQDARFLAANGQILWIERDALDDVGGFVAVKGEIVDDMALCRAMKKKGRRVVFADGHLMGRCRMYRSARAVIDGFSKNLFEGVGSVVGLVGIVALYGVAFIAPWIVLPAIVGGAIANSGGANLADVVDATVAVPIALPAAVAVFSSLALRALHVIRHGSGVMSALLLPLGTAVLLGIAVRSWWWSWRGKIEWSGRRYSGKKARMAHS
jgi:chlorobactene glucosyltransferase